MAGTVHLEHVGIRTTTEICDETISFYTGLLGWRVIDEFPSSGPDDRVLLLVDGRGVAFEVFVGSGRPIEAPSHLAFAVSFDEFPALAQRLTDAGVALDELSINEVGDRVSFFDDPASNRAQIVGHLKPLPS